MRGGRVLFWAFGNFCRMDVEALQMNEDQVNVT
jgi:hypothetical protein